MKITKLNISAHRQTNLEFDGLYEEISYDWRHKAELLQARRWRKLKHGVKLSVR